MATIGPTLPPHLQAKRKRDEDEDTNTTDHASAKSTSRSPTPQIDDAKRRRIAGPAPPPAPIDEMPPTPPNAVATEDQESSDDEYGPAPITKNSSASKAQSSISAFDLDSSYSLSKQDSTKPKRDEWMTLPPKADDLSRIDPLKPRAKGFATGRSAQAAGSKSGPDTMWTESMEQKQKRLRDEVMGVEKPTETQTDVLEESRRKAEEREKARKARVHTEKASAKSLYDQHQKSVAKKVEDDPSTRAFSYEKDVAKGPKLGHAQKKEMLSRAADFGSKFSSGSYL